MKIEMTFPGNKRVDAHFNGFTVHTDQPNSAGGDDSAPSPFDLFLASIGTCAGVYVLNFCAERGIDTEGLGLELHPRMNPESRMIDKITIRINLPQGFPDKYKETVRKVANLCAVKKHILNPPEFEILAK